MTDLSVFPDRYSECYREHHHISPLRPGQRDQDFTQLTEDHFTWPWLDRALGVEEDIQVDVMEEAVLPGDTYLLCSDGLTDMVTDESIQVILDKNDYDPDQTVRELVRTANENGGKDNISVILVKTGNN